MRDRTVRRLSRLHKLLFRATGGLIGKRLVENDMLLLSTTGRITGRPHTVPLLYLREGPDHVVIASYGGRNTHPDWYLNLRTQPNVRLQTDDAKWAAVARISTGPERELLWERVVEAYGGYSTYQSRTDREIPIVVLEAVT